MGEFVDLDKSTCGLRAMPRLNRYCDWMRTASLVARWKFGDGRRDAGTRAPFPPSPSIHPSTISASRAPTKSIIHADFDIVLQILHRQPLLDAAQCCA